MGYECQNRDTGVPAGKLLINRSGSLGQDEQSAAVGVMKESYPAVQMIRPRN
jgi:hypothetical protein